MSIFSITNLRTSLAPCSLEEICSIPHLVLSSSPDSVDACLEATGQPGGIFGMPMPYDLEGHAYLEPEDSVIIDDFVWWAESKNQSLVRNLGAIGKPTGFTMVINAYVSATTLHKLYSQLSPTRGYFDGETFLPYVLKSRNDIEWAYIPLPGEHDIAIFIVSDSRKETLINLNRLLQLRDQVHGRMEREGQNISIDMSSA